jgi:hypothetical protein
MPLLKPLRKDACLRKIGMHKAVICILANWQMLKRQKNLKLYTNLKAHNSSYGLLNLFEIKCGEGGRRTLGTVAHTTVFETVPFDRSGTSPDMRK